MKNKMILFLALTMATTVSCLDLGLGTGVVVRKTTATSDKNAQSPATQAVAAYKH